MGIGGGTGFEEREYSLESLLMEKYRHYTSKTLHYLAGGGVLLFAGAFAYTNDYPISGASMTIIGGCTMLLSSFLGYVYDSRLRNLQRKLTNSFDNSRERGAV